MNKFSIKRVVLMLLGIISVLGIFLFITPFVLTAFWGDDIASVNDSQLQLNEVPINESENIYYDLVKLTDYVDDSFFLPREIRKEFLTGEKWDQQIVDIIIIENKEFLIKWQQLSEKDYFQEPNSATPATMTLNDSIVYLGHWRLAAQLNVLESLALAKQGQINKAIDKAIINVKIGYLIEESQPPVLQYLFGLSVKESGLQTLQLINKEASLKNNISKENLEKLSLYYNDINIDVFKLEYLVYRNNLEKSFRLNSNKEIENTRNVNSNYYLKPNKTVQEMADRYQQLIKYVSISCDINDLPEYNMDKFELVWYKALFTENVIGKMLNTLAINFLSSIRNRKCNLNNLHLDILNLIK